MKHSISILIIALSYVMMVVGCTTTKLTTTPTDKSNCLKLTVSYQESSFSTYVCDSVAKGKIIEVISKLQ